MLPPFTDLSEDDKSARLLDYVQGRLSEAERLEIEAVTTRDTSLAEELAYYQGLANAANDAAPAADHEFGWAKLAKSIDKEAARTSDVTMAANDNFSIWKVATLALGIIALAQTALLAGSFTQATSEDPIYVPVTQPVSFDVQVIFIDTVTSARMTETLNALDADIVAGPSALGLYDIRFTSETTRDAGLQSLRAMQDVVESATRK